MRFCSSCGKRIYNKDSNYCVECIENGFDTEEEYDSFHYYRCLEDHIN